MTVYAFVENGQVTSVHDKLPMSWKNVSNLPALAEAELSSVGWYKIQKYTTPYDKDTQQLTNVRYMFVGDGVIESYDVIVKESPLPVAPQMIPIVPTDVGTQWRNIRAHRDSLMQAMEWRIQRYARQTRMGVAPTDDIQQIDNYMQQLSDITQCDDPDTIEWPVFEGM